MSLRCEWLDECELKAIIKFRTVEWKFFSVRINDDQMYRKPVIGRTMLTKPTSGHGPLRFFSLYPNLLLPKKDK